MSINYTILPDHMRDGARAYVETGRHPGDFLRAVLENNLVEAFNRADSKNVRAMLAWATWLYIDAPRSCWGSPERVDAWIEQGGAS